MKIILAIGAHPDDIEYAAFGYLYGEKARGAEINIVLLTGGENSVAIGDGVRKSEEEALCQRYGFNFAEFGRFHDGNLAFNSDSVGFIQRVIERVNPDIILTHYWNDTHQDHVAASRITLAAARYTNNILFYSSFSAVDFLPLMFYDISCLTEEKRKALHIFSSQTAKNQDRNIDLVEYALRVNYFYGTKICVSAAEGFIPSKYIL